jgi:hypothetical protein
MWLTHRPAILQRIPTVYPVIRRLLVAVHGVARDASRGLYGPSTGLLHMACTQNWAISYRDEDEAIRIANDNEYGLAGSVFTTDTDRGYGVATRVRSGTFGVNEGYIMDPAAPFGGVKDSGYGRELGAEGIDSYTVSQSISAAG